MELSLENIEEELKHILQHRYLQKYIQTPIIDQNKLILLYHLIEATPLEIEEKKKYIITTMLVQIALDTHDLVSETNSNESSEKKKSRQLTVLAGDYYSGLYYYILSKLNDVPMIHTLASAIKEMNELKMYMYYEKQQTLTIFLSRLKKLEAKLITRVGEHLRFPDINEFAENWLLTSKLTKEKHNFLMNKNTPVLDALNTDLVSGITRHDCVKTIEKAMNKYWEKSSSLLHELPSQFFLLRTELEDFFHDETPDFSSLLEQG